ncbi:MAG: very short patch repair endonuclease [Syntrophobacteraceae bacterium]
MEKFLKDKLLGGAFPEVEPLHTRIMKAVRGKGNRTTEQIFEKALVTSGIQNWEMHTRSIRGCPDFFFPNERIAVFLDGCFWHGCNRCGHIPKKNNAFWAAKISRNKERDAKTNATNRRHGISVLRFWEHRIRDDLEGCVSLLQKRIQERRQKVIATGGGRS